MRNCVALFLVLTLCVGCKLYDPHDYVVHATYSERYKDIAAYKRAISHLSKHEKMLVELYVDQEDLDEVQDGKTGKAATITQIIKIEQPVYEKQVADAKVIADNNDNMRKLISLTLTKKQSLISDEGPNATTTDPDQFLVSIDIKNLGQKTITALIGSAQIWDQTDQLLAVDINQTGTLPPGGVGHYQKLQDATRSPQELKLVAANVQDLHVVFVPVKIAFSDGKTMNAN